MHFQAYYNTLYKHAHIQSEHILTDSQLLFVSNKKWLYPIFDFTDYLSGELLDSSCIYVRDSIAGKAAAALLIDIGIQHCYIDTISELACSLFVMHGVSYSYKTCIERINCTTETILSDIWDIVDIQECIMKRRKDL